METSGCYQETVDTDTFHPRDPPEYERAEAANPGQVLPLPAPTEEAGGASSGQQLELGERAQMDHLGPLVIGEDGSVGRIANWTKLTEREREVALRRITARNRERLQRLRGEGGAAQEQGQHQQERQGGSGAGAVGAPAAAAEPGRQQEQRPTLGGRLQI